MLRYIKICKIVRVPIEVVKDCWIVEDWQRAAHWHFALSLFALFRFWQKQMRILLTKQWQSPMTHQDCGLPSSRFLSLSRRSFLVWEEFGLLNIPHEADWDNQIIFL